jgi:hypothetical protein
VAGVSSIVATLRKEEKKLASQLGKIRSAISTLEFGSGGGAPKEAVIRVRRRKRTVSAAQRKAQSLKMKAYWAKRKAGKKK